jgi:hypothetical protein
MISQANRHPGHATWLSVHPVEAIRPRINFSIPPAKVLTPSESEPIISFTTINYKKSLFFVYVVLALNWPDSIDINLPIDYH